MMKKFLMYFSIASILFSSCKKIIEIDTNNAEPQLVIEGKIDNRLLAQQIKISKSIAYDGQNKYPSVSGAVVTVSDSRGNIYNFAETQPGIYAFGMRGVPGVTYTMKVVVEGKTYTATSKMPAIVKLDSIGIVSNNFFGNERKTAAAYLVDPKSETNFYHFNLYVNDNASQRFYVSNDRLTDGNQLRIQLFFKSGNDNNDSDELNSKDKVKVEMETIDSNIFDYWYALSEQSGRGPNQGTTPANPTTNISNNALGYFSAHTYQALNIIVP
ncbi:DUF4249 domain-containing protein [Pedobacter mendelii]|uniref:DUF4249 domain-containing protein n=1 Tax=Pedobacter mendelii TaxID=1908240 RepID=A0ABQ2BBL7_9SPHI|nr:DUF4249 domain-containing protein [Pedobacter mendelii]GGI22329.1 hypothetical protein GCM10008119_02100 [Pedobacter mendelii]